ncbi:MAG: hypothetical protein V1934_07375 [Methanobacteriota archaeon]
MTGDKQRVLFVCDRPDFRCHKMAKGLLATGECEPYLLAAGYDRAIHAPAFSRAASLGGAFNNSFYIYRMLDLASRGRADLPSKHLLKVWLGSKMRNLEPYDVLHAMTPPVTLSKLAIECAAAPAVFDQYDLILESYGKGHRWPKEIEDERWCFEHAQGYVHKGPKAELDFYRQQGYNLAGPELSYPDGCEESMFQPVGGAKLRDKDGEWHIAYAGGIHGSGKPCWLLPEFEVLAGQKIHVHIYPAPYSQAHEDLTAYAAPGVGGGKIHMHQTLPYPELVKELARYDLGLYYFDLDSAKFPSQSKKLRTAAGNKIPTYYEAGLPVVVGKRLEYSATMVSEDGAGIVAGAEELPSLAERFKAADMRGLQEAVERARNRLSLSSQAIRLLEFYRKLA